jgi:hypothetical protein
VIGSGVSDASARILTELAPQKLSDILKDESTEKSNQVKKDVLTAFTPFIKSMAGNEGGIALFNDFRAQGEKLSAYYIVNGMSSADASAKAFKELIGDRYEFRDSWRAPKGLPQPIDDIQRGTVQAMRDLETLGIAPPRDTVGGLSPEGLIKAKADAIRRDGKWVTAPDESGLALVYNDEAVRRGDGKPLILPWSQLGRCRAKQAAILRGVRHADRRRRAARSGDAMTIFTDGCGSSRRTAASPTMPARSGDSLGATVQRGAGGFAVLAAAGIGELEQAKGNDLSRMSGVDDALTFGGAAGAGVGGPDDRQGSRLPNASRRPVSIRTSSCRTRTRSRRRRSTS